jgi:hypothetical protein
MIAKIAAGLGWVSGSLLGLAIIISLTLLPVFVVLWIATALDVPWAGDVQMRIAAWGAAVLTAADRLLPAWAWFALIGLLWLSFLDLHVRWLVRDELSKSRKDTR